MSKISDMITVAYLSKDRPEHLFRSLKSMTEQTVCPLKIIVVDCSESPDSIRDVINDVQSPVDIEFHWRPVEQLSRSQGRNLGCSLAATPIVVSTECDILYDPMIIEKTISAFGSPLKSIFAQPQSKFQLENGEYRKAYGTGYFQSFRLVDFKKVGGYNPFLKLGMVEDNDFRHRMVEFGCEEVTLNSTVTHMWHDSNERSHKNRMINKEICRHSRWNGNQWELLNDEGVVVEIQQSY